VRQPSSCMCATLQRSYLIAETICCCGNSQSVRVVQRNLVYVVGLAMDICYEDVLRGSEYFGQFGKPIKVNYFCRVSSPA